MGKGSTYRPVNKKKFDKNFEAIFGKKEIKTWNPNEDEENEDTTTAASHTNNQGH